MNGRRAATLAAGGIIWIGGWVGGYTAGHFALEIDGSGHLNASVALDGGGSDPWPDPPPPPPDRPPGGPA